MYQNIIYDEGQIINPFECMKLLNYFYDENIDLVKMNEQLREENKELKELVSEVDNELEIRDIVCGAGKFRLEEWGKHRYHQFYKGDEELEDESIVIMLMELEKENKELKARCEEYRKLSVQYKQKYDEKISDNTFLEEENKELQKENEQLKSKNKILLEHCDDLQERNDRQADTIRELYNLIENKDWETLTGMINDFKECEEQLQREWKCYE